MVEMAVYKNNFGESITFGTNGIFLNYSNLHDYNWGYDTTGNKVENIKRMSSVKKLPVIIIAESEEKGYEIRNYLYNIMEKDVIAGRAGRLYIGSYYIECFMISNEKSEYLKTKRIMKMNANLVTAKGVWLKETRHEYLWHQTTDTAGRGYNYGYDYDYTMGNGNIATIQNTHFAPCNFVLKISGYVRNPAVTIGNHIYRVNEVVQKNEILTIDTRNKTITLTKNNGVQVNVFSKRDNSSYPFEPIPTGEQRLYWNSNFNLEITLYEERSEPLWT